MVNQTISLPAASLVGFLLETLLYGAYVVVFMEHLKILGRRRADTWAFKYQCITSVALFLTITMRTIVDMAQAVDAYTGPIDAPTVITGFSRILNKLKIGLYSTEILNADLFLVYRVYVLWGHSLIVTAIPLCMWIVVLAFNVWGNIALLSNIPNTVGSSDVTRIAKFPLIGTTVLNVVCTALIAGRIWWIQRSTQIPNRSSADGNRDPVSRAFVIIVESAAIYVGWLIALVATEIVSSNVYFMIFAFISPIVGLVFSTIIIRSCADNALNNTYVESKLSIHFRTNPRFQTNTTHLETFRAGTNPDESYDSSTGMQSQRKDVLQLGSSANPRSQAQREHEDALDASERDSKLFRGDSDLQV